MLVKTQRDRDAEVEAKLAELEGAAAAEAADPMNQPTANLPPDEVTYRKRYGDLRSHTARREAELQAEIKALKNQVADAAKEGINFPKTEAEIEAWASRYPEAYDTFVTIARRNAIDVQKEVAEKLTAIESREFESAKAIAKRELYAAHADFPDLATSQDFIDWIESQPKYIYNALYENETDSASAIRAVDLYKADKGILQSATDKKEKEAPRANAADRVPPGQKTAVANAGQPKWTESKLASVNWNKLTEAQLAEIDEAQNDPGFYDISGGAR